MSDDKAVTFEQIRRMYVGSRFRIGPDDQLWQFVDCESETPNSVTVHIQPAYVERRDMVFKIIMTMTGEGRKCNLEAYSPYDILHVELSGLDIDAGVCCIMVPLMEKIRLALDILACSSPERFWLGVEQKRTDLQNELKKCRENLRLREASDRPY